MAASRLSEGQKAEIIERYRQGAGSVELADAHGCSPNTISRVLKAGLEPAEYERLKRRRGNRSVQDAPSAPAPAVLSGAAGSAERQAGAAPAAAAAPAVPERASGALALGDAEDFAAVAVESGYADADFDPEDFRDPEFEDPDFVDPDDEDPDDEDADGEAAEDGLEASLAGDGDDGADAEGSDGALTTITPLSEERAGGASRPTVLQAWGTASLPGSAYMLVEKTVELQPQLLQELSELGHLPEDELQRRALVLYVNPRQAKRQCGRNQRVIRIPDTQVLELTASKLLAQGISRVVVEGSLYALPGS